MNIRGPVVEAGVLSRLRRGTIEAVAFRGAGVSLLFLMHAVLGRAIGSEGYGVVSYALAIVSVLAIVVPLGWPTALMRFIAQYSEQQRWRLLRGAVIRAYQITLLTAGLVALALWGISYWESLSPDLATSLRFAALLLPLLALVILRSRALQGMQNVSGSIVPDQVVLPLLVIVGMYTFTVTTASGALLVYAGSSFAVFLLGTFWLLRSMPAEGRSVKPEFKTRAWMIVALPMVFGGLSQILMNRADVLMLGAIMNMESVGIYSAANRIALLNTFAMTAVSYIGAPLMTAAYHGNRRRQFSMILRQTTLFSILGALPLLMVMFFWPQIVLGFFGSEFKEGALLLQILAVGQFVNAATGPVGFALMMTGQERAFALATAGLAVCNIVGNLVAIPVWGTEGAAAVTAMSVTALNIWLLLLVKKLVYGDTE